ncbi:MAG: NADH-quinone oxidoreductase subunit J, partial [Planctomycetes bacterium]|nr:NADH-quinone oxidoreductase subunit J [Planctomycetota bacterium]
AGLYLMLGAEFLAFVQVIVYVGGTTILIMFGVMLTARSPVEVQRKGDNRALPAIIVVCLVLIPLLTTFMGLKVNWHDGVKAAETIAPQDTRNLGDMLLTSYIAPFVIASFVLLIALVGAAYLVRRREEPADAEPNEELARS